MGAGIVLRFKSKAQASKLETLELVGFPEVEAYIADAVAAAKAYAGGVALTKQLVSTQHPHAAGTMRLILRQTFGG